MRKSYNFLIESDRSGHTLTLVNVNSPTVNDDIHASTGGAPDSGWGRTAPQPG